jgi:hypothetical protein
LASSGCATCGGKVVKSTTKTAGEGGAKKAPTGGIPLSKLKLPKATSPTEKPEAEYSAKQFFLEDYGRTLFPLTTNKVLVEHGEDRIRAYIDKLLKNNHAFLPQRRVYAAKDALHLRRTVKLDPVAEFFIYDLIYRNRSIFRNPHSKSRMHFGYRFEGGRPVPGSRSYKEFKLAIWDQNIWALNFLGFDVASYFNHVYHHDLVEWFAARGAEDGDVEAFGKFLREANAGRTLDCLPQGLYPTKMIGNDFLRFVEESHSVKAENILRFMDDFYLFADDEDALKADFAEIQRLLGQKGLSVNAGKTTTVQPHTERADEGVSELKKKLLERRRGLVEANSYDDDDEELDDDADDESGDAGNEADLLLDLTDEELEYITSILQGGSLEEDDAELILTVMRRHTENVTDHLPTITKQFPHLAKNVYRFCVDIADKELVGSIILGIATDGSPVQEYQLFWFGMMLEEYLLDTTNAPALIGALFNHPNSTDISKAKILEIPDQRFGLPELRANYLATGQSDWLSWASAVGSRTMKSAARNYKLNYFKNSSDMNRLIGEIIGAL